MKIVTWLLKKVKSSWGILFFLVPVVVYAILRFYERELALFIMPYFPVEEDKSLGFYKDFIRLCSDEMLWLTFYFLVAWSLFVYFPLNRFIDEIEKRLFKRYRFYVALIIVLSFILSIVISVHTLQKFPNSADEYVYLFQAETLSQGKLWQTPHPLPEFFHVNHIAQKDGMRVGRFPPGWPIILSTSYFLHFPAFLVNPILGLLALIVFYAFTNEVYNKSVAIWSLISVALTSFYLFNSASFFSHTSCFLYVAGFVYGVYYYEKKNSPAYALVAGAFLGIMVISRYYTAALVSLPMGVYLLYQYKLKSIAAIIWIGLGCLPSIIFLFWYNFKITGNGFLPVTIWTNSQESLGFVLGHSFIKGTEHIVRRFFMFFYWCSPGLLLLYFLFLFQKLKDKSDRIMHPEDYIFILLIFGYFFYYHIGGNQYGPRFYFEGFPFLAAFVARKVFQTRAKWALALFVASLIYGIVKIPFIMAREQRIVKERVDVYKLANDQKISNAVILISSSTGVIRPMQQPELARNDMDFTSDVIYAWDLGDKNEALIHYYPGRSFYKYLRDPDQVTGKLVKLN